MKILIATLGITFALVLTTFLAVLVIVTIGNGRRRQRMAIYHETGVLPDMQRFDKFSDWLLERM